MDEEIENINIAENPHCGIHIKNYSKNKSSKEFYIVAKPTRFDLQKPSFIWVFATIVIGISVASFSLNSVEAIVTMLSQKKDQIADASFSGATNTTLSTTTDQPQKNMGSDDADYPDPEQSIFSIGEVPKLGKYYFKNKDNKLPKTSALSFIVGDVTTGEIIIEKNSDMVLPMASLSKLIAALVSKDVLDQHIPVKVSKSSVATYGTLGGLNAGEKILPNDLLYPLLMESSNDAAEVLAEDYGRNAFLEKMNKKAKDLSMDKTFFTDPSGLSQGNVSTAKNLFILAKYIDKEKPEIWDITRIRQYAILSHSWANNNHLSRKSNFIGGKNGYTEEANRTTVSLFSENIEKEKRKIAVVILKSNDRDGDVDLLLRFIEKNVGFIPDIKASNSLATSTASTTASTTLQK